MLIASSGWIFNCHYTMLHDQDKSQVHTTVTLPQGKKLEYAAGSIKAATKWIEQQVYKQRKFVDESM